MKRFLLTITILLSFVSRANAQLTQAAVNCGTQSLCSGTFTCTLGSNPTAGNTLMFTSASQTSGGSQQLVSSVASTNDTLSLVNSTGFIASGIWCKNNIVGGANSKTVTITLAGGTGSCRELGKLFEVNASASGCTVDQSTNATGNNTAPNTGATAATANPSDFVVGVMGGKFLCSSLSNVGTTSPSNPTTGWNNVGGCVDENGFPTSNNTLYNQPGGTGAFELAQTTSTTNFWGNNITAFLPGIAPAGTCTPNAAVRLLNSSKKVMNGTASAVNGTANWDVLATDTSGFLVDTFNGSASLTTGQPFLTVRIVDNAGKVCSGTDSAVAGTSMRTYRVCNTSNQVAGCIESATSATYDYSVNLIDANGKIDDAF